MDRKPQLRATLTQRQAEAKKLTATIAALTEQIEWNAFEVNNPIDQINEWGMYFLDFPPEIRLMIYKELLPSVLHIPFTRTSGLQLLVSCRQVRAEFLPLIRALPTAVVHLHDPFAVKEFLRWIEPKAESPPIGLTRRVVEAQSPRIGYNNKDCCYGAIGCNGFREELAINDKTNDIQVLSGKSFGKDPSDLSYVQWHTQTSLGSNVWLPLRGLKFNAQGKRVSSYFEFHEIDTILSMLSECTSTDHVTDLGNDAVPAGYFFTGSAPPRPPGIARMKLVHWLNQKYFVRRTKYPGRIFDLTDVEFEL